MQEWNAQAILGLIVIVIAFGALIAYPKLQYNAIRQLRGGWRAFSFLPLAVMGIVVAVTVPALIEGANLWPLYLIFITPFAAVYLVALNAAHRFVERRRERPSESRPV